jgi:hypothetical protein
MILLHRLTPFAIALTVVAGMITMILVPEHAMLAGLLMVLVCGLLYARLLQWDVKHVAFWIFLGTPILLLISACIYFLFLDQQTLKIILAILLTGSTWLYAENVFSFYHLPSTYQPYSLEYLSMMLYLFSAFFFTSGTYGVQLFLQLPFWVPALAVFWVSLFMTTGVFWVSKINTEISTRFAFSGAVILTELYIALSQLPTSYVANAAAFTVMLYLYLGLSRAHVLEKLSKPVMRRYVFISVVLLVVIFGTARWI